MTVVTFVWFLPTANPQYELNVLQLHAYEFADDSINDHSIESGISDNIFKGLLEHIAHIRTAVYY